MNGQTRKYTNIQTIFLRNVEANYKRKLKNIKFHHKEVFLQFQTSNLQNSFQQNCCLLLKAEGVINKECQHNIFLVLDILTLLRFIVDNVKQKTGDLKSVWFGLFKTDFFNPSLMKL